MLPIAALKGAFCQAVTPKDTDLIATSLYGSSTLALATHLARLTAVTHKSGSGHDNHGLMDEDLPRHTACANKSLSHHIAKTPSSTELLVS